jgi:hypothetical protein
MEWVVVAAVIVVAVLLVAAAVALRRRRTATLREGFGPEYDRALEEHGDQRAAEDDLRRRRDRRRGLEIRPLAREARERYAERWSATQRRFVDAPASAVAEADDLVGRVMRERGYPVDDFEQRAADVSVDHPETVENYRQAHAISVDSAQGTASTEDLRKAMVHYRALFDDLLRDGDDGTNGVRDRRTRHAEEMS